MNTIPQIHKMSRASQLSVLAVVILLGAVFFTINTAQQQQSSASHASGYDCYTFGQISYCNHYPTPTPYVLSGQTCKYIWNGITYARVCSSATPTPLPTVRPAATPTSAPIPAPTALTATPGNGKITLNWDAIGGDYYYIYERNVTQGQSTFTKLPYPVTTNTFTYTPIPNGQTFAFKVSAIGTNGAEGPLSSAVSAIVGGSTSLPTATPASVPTATPTPTPTAVPVTQSAPTPLPTNTPVPGTTVVNVIVGMQGVGTGGDSASPNSVGNMNPQRPDRTITMQIYDASNQLVMSQQGTVHFDPGTGKFSGTVNLGSDFVTGLYSIKIKTDQYLRGLVPGIQTITSGQLTTLPPVMLVVGDINGDNAINIIDYNLMMGCYSDLLPPVDCTATNNTLSDLNDDDHVNQIDYNLFLRELTNIGGE